MDRNKINPIDPYISVIANTEGLSLVEVLVATVVLAVGLLGVAVLQYAAIAGNAFGREMQIATELGQELLETARSTAVRDALGNINGIFVQGVHPTSADETDIPSLKNPVGSGDPNYDATTRAGGMTFNRVWWVRDNCRDINVEYKSDNPCDRTSEVGCASALNGMKSIAVRVCWVDKNGGNHSVSLSGIKWDETAAP